MNKPITPKEFEQILKETWDKSAEGFTQEEKDKYFNVVINSIGNAASLEQPEPRMFLDLSKSNGNHPVNQPLPKAIKEKNNV